MTSLLTERSLCRRGLRLRALNRKRADQQYQEIQVLNENREFDGRMADFEDCYAFLQRGELRGVFGSTELLEGDVAKIMVKQKNTDILYWLSKMTARLHERLQRGGLVHEKDYILNNRTSCTDKTKAIICVTFLMPPEAEEGKEQEVPTPAPAPAPPAVVETLPQLEEASSKRQRQGGE